MNKLFREAIPFTRPNIVVTPKRNTTFDIKINESPWMYCDLRIGKRITWGIYDAPDWELTDCAITNTYRKANIHGIDCVESMIQDYSSPTDEQPCRTHSLYVHADEDQIQYVAASEIKDGVFHLTSLFDDSFIKNYSIEMPRVVIDMGYDVYNDNNFTSINVSTHDDSVLMGAGVFDVTIGEKSFECLRIIDRWQKSPRILVENYMSREGRSILFRRYNHPVWKLERYKQRWDEKLPNSETLSINGETYIHWYDCLSDIAYK